MSVCVCAQDNTVPFCVAFVRVEDASVCVCVFECVQMEYTSCSCRIRWFGYVKRICKSKTLQCVGARVHEANLLTFAAAARFNPDGIQAAALTFVNTYSVRLRVCMKRIF